LSWSGLYPPSTVQVREEENPEVGRLLGPDGKLAKIVRAKEERPAGFRPEERPHAR
jgi:hypothetical protein